MSFDKLVDGWCSVAGIHDLRRRKRVHHKWTQPPTPPIQAWTPVEIPIGSREHAGDPLQPYSHVAFHRNSPASANQKHTYRPSHVYFRRRINVPLLSDDTAEAMEIHVLAEAAANVYLNGVEVDDEATRGVRHTAAGVDDVADGGRLNASAAAAAAERAYRRSLPHMTRRIVVQRYNARRWRASPMRPLRHTHAHYVTGDNVVCAAVALSRPDNGTFYFDARVLWREDQKTHRTLRPSSAQAAALIDHANADAAATQWALSVLAGDPTTRKGHTATETEAEAAAVAAENHAVVPLAFDGGVFDASHAPNLVCDDVLLGVCETVCAGVGAAVACDCRDGKLASYRCAPLAAAAAAAAVDASRFDGFDAWAAAQDSAAPTPSPTSTFQAALAVPSACDATAASVCRIQCHPLPPRVCQCSPMQPSALLVVHCWRADEVAAKEKAAAADALAPLLPEPHAVPVIADINVN